MIVTPHVTDHAVVRYCQRAQGRTEETVQELRAAGVDVDALRLWIAELVTPDIANGSPGRTHGNVRFMLTQHVVTTTLTRAMFYGARFPGRRRCAMPDLHLWRLSPRQEARA